MKYLLPVFLLLLGSTAYAQHCGFDFAGIVMIEPHSSETDTTIIPGLTITLLDKNFAPIVNYRNDTAIMYRNDVSMIDRSERSYTPCYFLAGKRSYCWSGTYYFGFAAENYISVIGYDRDRKALYAKIEDNNVSRASGKYETKIINIPLDMYYSLCTHYRWDRIKPLKIILDRQ
jgi:hypothetical protein